MRNPRRCERELVFIQTTTVHPCCYSRMLPVVPSCVVSDEVPPNEMPLPYPTLSWPSSSFRFRRVKGEASGAPLRSEPSPMSVFLS